MGVSSLKYNFDKHPAPVSCLEFFEVYKLVSGGEDGSTMIHDLSTVETVSKRTNVFESKNPYSVVKIVVAEAGIAYVLDSLSVIKMYDLWRNEKVGIVVASPPLKKTIKFRKWNIDTPAMLIVSGNITLMQTNWLSYLTTPMRINQRDANPQSSRLLRSSRVCWGCSMLWRWCIARA